MKSIPLIVAFFAITSIFLIQLARAANPNPTNANEALTSYTWKYHVDNHTEEVQFYRNGTTNGSLHWHATGGHTFMINEDTPCVFDETFTNFTGLWTERDGREHPETGLRVTPSEASGGPPAPSIPGHPLLSEDFEKALLAHAWSWVAAGARNDAALAFTFSADGTVKSSTGLKLPWKWVGPRMLKIESPDGRAALLIFDEAFQRFDTQGFDGKSNIAGAQRVLAAAATPIPSISSIPVVPPFTPAIPSQVSTKPSGIAIAGIRQDRSSVLMATGGHSQELGDLRALLSAYGTASVDTEPHPEAEIYPGIRYLMPWHEAEKVLVPTKAPTRSGDKIACAGFPDGLNWICYDGAWAYNGRTYNHLYILKDIASQVVCIELRQEHGFWLQPVPPWQTLDGEWHVIDYINAEVKGQKGIHIVTQVLDERNGQHRIVVNTTNRKIDHTATMFLPEALINLILYCTR